MKKQNKVPIIIAFCIAVAFIVIAVIFSRSYDSSERNGTTYPFNEGWVRILDDGTEIPFTDFGISIDDKHVLLKHDLKSIDSINNSLGFYNYYSAVTIRIDGEIIYRYGTLQDINNKILLGNYYSMVNVYHGHDSDGYLFAEFSSNEPVTVYGFDVGSGSSLEMAMIREYLSTLILPIIAVLFLIVLIVMKRKKITKDLLNLQHLWFIIFIFNISLWILADSQLPMDVGFNAGSVCLFSFEIYMLLPISIMMFLYHSCHRLKEADIFVCVISFIDFILVNFLYFSGICSFLQSLPATHVCVAAAMVVGQIQVIDEYLRNQKRYAVFLLIGYSVFSLSAIIQYIHFFSNPSASNSRILQFGAIVFTILQIANVLQVLNDHIYQVNVQLEMKNKLLQKTFGSFVPEEMLQNILDDPDEITISGDTRQLTVLQSDIRGFSEIIHQMSATDAIDMLNHYLETMTTIIMRHGGTIMEFVGDGIIATFDSKLHSDRHADKAIFTAVEMQNSMEDINTWNRDHNYPEFEMGIGVNSGIAYVGYIGSNERLKYDAIGSTINLVSRIESYSTGGQILISQSCKEAATIELIIANEYSVVPKGYYEGITLYLIGGIGSPYNIMCDQNNETPILLDIPEVITFNTVENKHCGNREYAGIVIAASETRATIQTDCPLMLFDNIMIYSNGHISGKVISKSKNGFLVRFTSIPKNYDGWGTLKQRNTDIDQ